MIDLTAYTFSARAIINRYRAIKPTLWRWMNVLRGVSNQGIGRIKYYTEVLNLLQTDRKFRAFYEQETTEVPQFFLERLQRDLGPLWEWLPKGAVYHDAYAYLKVAQQKQYVAVAAKLPD
jgi:hypothetical protein